MKCGLSGVPGACVCDGRGCATFENTPQGDLAARTFARARGLMGVPGLGDYSDDLAEFRRYNRAARDAAANNERDAGYRLLAQAEAVSSRNPSVDPGGAEAAYTREILAGDPDAQRAYGGGANLQAVAEDNQPGFWDRFTNAFWDTPLVGVPFGPSVTLREGVTTAGGYTSAAGITDPQSGADIKAKRSAARDLCQVPGTKWDEERQECLIEICEKLPAPLDWVCRNPGKSAAIGAGALGVIFFGPMILTNAKSWYRAVRS